MRALCFAVSSLGREGVSWVTPAPSLLFWGWWWGLVSPLHTPPVGVWGAAALAWLPSGSGLGGMLGSGSARVSWGGLWGLDGALRFILILSPPAFFPHNAFPSVVFGEGGRGKKRSKVGGGDAMGCQGEGLSLFP